ncbi:MAG: peptidylprolyl isomerase [Candidatus Gastranaerophilales bacterium]|nr:peptidylprolyl isomerase [Candidatus Gastranaerophilales bacterium]
MDNNETQSKALYQKQPEATSVRAAHILVPSYDEAINVKQQIESGKITFAQAAEKYSKCPSGKNGGDLGYFTRGQMVPEFDKASFTLPVNTVSDPVKTQFGYHLIEVLDRK